MAKLKWKPSKVISDRVILYMKMTIPLPGITSHSFALLPLKISLLDHKNEPASYPSYQRITLSDIAFLGPFTLSFFPLLEQDLDKI